MSSNIVQPHLHDTNTICFAKSNNKAFANSAANNPCLTLVYVYTCELEHQILRLLIEDYTEAAPFQLLTALLCAVIKQNTAIAQNITALEANLAKANNTIASLTHSVYRTQPPPATTSQQSTKTADEPAWSSPGNNSNLCRQSGHASSSQLR